MQKGSATLRWSRPATDGGAPITTFRVERRALGAYRWDPVNPAETITETSYTVAGLQPDTDYEFRVLAENRVGVSAPSPTSRSAKYGQFRFRFAARAGVIREWLGSRVASVLDSGAEGPGFKSQSRRCRVTVLGKLFTPIVPMFTKQQNW